MQLCTEINTSAAHWLRLSLLGVSLVAMSLLQTALASATPSDDCKASGDLHFVCGLAQPEDLVGVPGTHWIIASGLDLHNGGLFLVDTDAKASRKLTIGEQIQIHHDATTYPACAGPPLAANFAAHGLSLRSRSPSQATLYVVGHGGREAIEVFNVQANGAEPPVLSWLGCVSMPAAAGVATNSVTSLPNGTIYATVLYRTGTSFQDIFDGKSTGEVYKWAVGSGQFERVPGLSLSGDNGISASPDGRELFVLASGSQQLIALSLANPSLPPRSAHFDTFTPDNVHYGPNGQLLVAGMRTNEPSCGGPPKMVNGKPNIADCNRGSIVALVNPKTLAVHIVYDGAPNQNFSGVATGLLMGKQLWLSSFATTRVAYLDLPLTRAAK